MKMQWLSPADKKWRAHLSNMPHDIYHRPEYVRGEAELVTGTPRAILVEAGQRTLFLPLVVREIPNTLVFDATSPNGYPGPLVSTVGETPFAEARFVADAMGLVLQGMQHRQIVSAFIRCHPFLEQAVAGMGVHGEIVEHSSTVYIDLEQSEEQLWKQTRASHRSEINRCRKNGFESVIDLDWSRLDDFIAMYYETMRRVSAGVEHFYPRSYFEMLRDQLAEHAFLSMVFHDGVPTSGGIFTKCEEIVQYHLGATANAFIRQHPSKLLLDFTRRWAKENGYKKMHLGGGANCRADALLNFKLGFSKLRKTFRTYRFIADQAAYRDLVQAWEWKYGSMADGIQGFFPAYRKPAAAAGAKENVEATLPGRITA